MINEKEKNNLIVTDEEIRKRQKKRELNKNKTLEERQFERMKGFLQYEINGLETEQEQKILLEQTQKACDELLKQF